MAPHAGPCGRSDGREVALAAEYAALYHRTMVREAALEKTEAGLVPVSGGWFVLNAREARWTRGQNSTRPPQNSGRTRQAGDRTACAN